MVWIENLPVIPPSYGQVHWEVMLLEVYEWPLEFGQYVDTQAC